MTYDEVIHLLEQVSEIDEMVLRKQSHIEDLKSRLGASAIRYDKPSVQTSPDDLMASVMAEIDLLEREALEDIARYIHMKSRVLAVLDQLPDLTWRNILYLRYLENNRMFQIAMKLSISEATLYRYRSDAINWICTNIERM